jgi:hypothetical protein
MNRRLFVFIFAFYFVRALFAFPPRLPMLPFNDVLTQEFHVFLPFTKHNKITRREKKQNAVQLEELIREEKSGRK